MFVHSLKCQREITVDTCQENFWLKLKKWNSDETQRYWLYNWNFDLYITNDCTLPKYWNLSNYYFNTKLEIVDQWSTRIPHPIGEGSNGQWVDCNWTLFKITRQPFWKRHSWQSLGFCLQPQRTCTWNLKLKFQSKPELRCRNHAVQKPKNLIWPPGSHLENEVTENQ